MNKENISTTIERLSSIPGKEYKQSKWSHECGTPACIAGHAVMAAIETDMKFVKNWMAERRSIQITEDMDSQLIYDILKADGVSELARSWLGLEYEQSDILFNACPTLFGGPVNPVKSQAVKVLKGLAETGETDWSLAIFKDE